MAEFAVKDEDLIHPRKGGCEFLTVVVYDDCDFCLRPCITEQTQCGCCENQFADPS